MPHPDTSDERRFHHSSGEVGGGDACVAEEARVVDDAVVRPEHEDGHEHREEWQADSRRREYPRGEAAVHASVLWHPPDASSGSHDVVSPP